ncbi:serine/threonine-protein phosphatase 2A regulatory subunit B'' subunit alpha-like [Cottoperca gobio]|uniref:Serine/threonine-protein phosphatase 2A regulatory subunit B'' subunit alpha-like n=1 Tax=Cottoperca gobio TaxID=56716 RepID=A0A6J2S5N7_COTGO|nr:serine/threonine-protein phosphatase 2A regulatory subunit B'' subunit alpha-like [Cottoperca gobio]
MAAAYRVVVSSVSCYNSVVVDRRTHSHAVHYCSGPCGALSQGLDCTVAHHGTCSELLIAPDAVYTDPNISLMHSHNMITQQLPNHGKITVTMDSSYNGGVERSDSSGNLSLGEDSPTWRGKKAPTSVGSTGNLSSFGSLKDITEEAINLASGKLKEFSFDKLRLSSSSHVTFRKGRKVRPDSLSRRSTDLEIIYGHFSSNITTNGTANVMLNGTGTSNDENLPPFVPGKVASLEETKLKGSTATLSAIAKVCGGSTSSLSGIGSLDQSLNTVASLYRNTLGEENLIARLLEKTRAEVGTGAGGEDIRACLDILLKCSEDLKKCTDIIKQCIRHKSGGEPEDGEASPDSVYRAVMTRLSSYLKRLPLEMEGIGSLGGSGQGGQGAPGSGHSDLAELVSTLHSIQQGPYSPIFGNEQPPRYEDVVLSPPIQKTVTHTASSISSLKLDSIHTKPIQSSPSRVTPLTNGLQHSHPSITQHTLSPPSITCSPSSSSPTHSPSPLRTSPTPRYTHTPPASPMEALYIEEEEADVAKTPEQISQQTHTPTRGVNTNQNKNGITLGQHMHLSHPQTLHNSNTLPANTGFSPPWPSSASLTISAPKAVSHRNDDIDKLLMDLENLSQSMSHPRSTEPPLPAKTRKREGGQGITSSEALNQPKMAQFQVQKPVNHLASNGPTSRTPQGENSLAVVGEEEDGALLLRILESIESFAQELVDSGAGSTGSAERNSGKEREVMRLLQDTMATTGRADTPLESTTPPGAPIAPSMHTHAATNIPAVPPKHSLVNTPAVSLAPTPIPAVAEAVCNATSKPAPKPTPETAPKPLPTPIPEPTTETTDTVTEASTGEADPTSIPDLVTSAPASLHSSTHSAEPSPVAASEAPAPVAIPDVVAARDTAIAVGDPAAVRDTGSTLLIQQTPAVIRWGCSSANGDMIYTPTSTPGCTQSCHSDGLINPLLISVYLPTATDVLLG